MTTHSEAREAVYNKFSQEWGTTTPFALDNEDLDTASLQAWCRVVVRNKAAGQETLGSPGNRRFERSADAIVQIFVKGGEATDQSSALAEQAQAIFEGVSIAGTSVSFRNVPITEVGADEANEWYQVNVTADFRYDERK